MVEFYLLYTIYLLIIMVAVQIYDVRRFFLSSKALMTLFIFFPSILLSLTPAFSLPLVFISYLYLFCYF